MVSDVACGNRSPSGAQFWGGTWRPLGQFGFSQTGGVTGFQWVELRVPRRFTPLFQMSQENDWLKERKERGRKEREKEREIGRKKRKSLRMCGTQQTKILKANWWLWILGGKQQKYFALFYYIYLWISSIILRQRPICEYFRQNNLIQMNYI